MSKSAVRALQIMEYIAEQRQGCTHTQLAQQLDIPKSSMTALLVDLQSQGYLQRDAETGRFSIGVQVLRLANAYLRSLNLARIGTPVIGELYAAVQQFSALAIPSGTEYVVICSESIPDVFAHTLQLGFRGPLYCSAVGRAILAYLPETRVDVILKTSRLRALTPFTKTDPAAIKALLPGIRKRGICYSRDENIAGILGVGAPVLDRSGSPVAAVGVALSSAHFDKRKAPAVEDAIRRAARKLSQQLGWQGPLNAK